MKSNAEKEDVISLTNILNQTGKISINTDLYKAFGLDNADQGDTKPRYEAPKASEETEKKPVVEENKEKDYDP